MIDYIREDFTKNGTTYDLIFDVVPATVLEGSVRRAGSRVRVTTQLINAEDGCHLWSERYDRELTDVFAIQDDIAQAIAGTLQVKLTSTPARHTPNVPAYEALLKARYHSRAYLPDAHARAKEHCDQAIALDPGYAAPHALLGFNYLFATTHTGRPIREVAPLIRREARRALELDPFEPTRISCWVRLQPSTTTIGRKPLASFSWPSPVRPCQPTRIGPTPALACSPSATSRNPRRGCVGPWNKTR